MLRLIDMLEPRPFGSGGFDIVAALLTILNAASVFDSKGMSDLWIYFVGGRLHFSSHQIPLPVCCFVGYYSCRDIISGLSKCQKQDLYRMLAIVYYTVQN